jgi:glycosyltransferase involved in cell wall biosynthesis
MSFRLKILSVNGSDRCGGAERLAWDLFNSYRMLGHRSWLMVGEKTSNDPDSLSFPRAMAGPWNRAWRGVRHRVMALADRWPRARIDRCLPLIQNVAEPGKWYDRVNGYDDYRYPGTYRMLEGVPQRPDIVHCHNLHGYYFDLRALPSLSRQVPVVLSLHDGWLLSGLCGHSFDCERWKTGCGRCPYLSVWQDPLWSQRDGTAVNWRRKKRIFAKSKLYVTVPCQWMWEKVEQSILAPAVRDLRVVPYGVNLAVFQPGDRAAARKSLGIPIDANVILTVARGIANNPSKDYATLRDAMNQLGETQRTTKTIFVVRGESLPAEHTGTVEIRYVPWADDHGNVVRYYQAADIYVHAARMDTFPLSVLEAQACGLPVVASAVGGIPEQLKNLVDPDDAAGNKATGLLVRPMDAAAMARALGRLLENTALREQLGENAVTHARQRFDLQRQATDYLDWYTEIVQRHGQATKRGRSNGRNEIMPLHSSAIGNS